MPHPIQAYCDRHDLSLNRLAGKIGVNSSTIIRIVNLARRPSAELMGRIERATDGGVTVAQLFAVHFGPQTGSLCQDGTNCKGLIPLDAVPGEAA